MLLSLQVLKTSTKTQQKLWLPTEYSGDICYAANAMCVMQATPTTRRRPYHVTCNVFIKIRKYARKSNWKIKPKKTCSMLFSIMSMTKTKSVLPTISYSYFLTKICWFKRSLDIFMGRAYAVNGPLQVNVIQTRNICHIWYIIISLWSIKRNGNTTLRYNCI